MTWLSEGLSRAAPVVQAVWKGAVVTAGFLAGVAAALSTTSPGAPTEVYTESGRCSAPLTTEVGCSILGRELVLRNPDEYFLIVDDQGFIQYAIPSNAIPSNAIPAEAIPANLIPADAIPSNLRIMDALPASAIPSNAIPAELAGVELAVVQNPFLKRMRVQDDYEPLGERVCGYSGSRCNITIQLYTNGGSVWGTTSSGDPFYGGWVWAPPNSSQSGGCSEDLGYVRAYAYDLSNGNMAVNIIHTGGYAQSKYRIRIGSRDFDCEIWPENRERLVCVVPRQAVSSTVSLYPGSANCALLTQVNVEVSSSAPQEPPPSGGAGNDEGSGSSGTASGGSSGDSGSSAGEEIGGPACSAGLGSSDCSLSGGNYITPICVTSPCPASFCACP